MTVELNDLEELAQEIRRLIESNRQFLERVIDEDLEEDESEGEAASDEDVFEEL